MHPDTSKKVWFGILKNSVLPVFIGLAILFFYVRFRQADVYLPQEWGRHLGNLFFTAVILFVTYWVQNISNAIFDYYNENIAKKTKTDLDDIFVPLFKKVANVVIWVIALLTLLSRFGVNINALIAALGVSSLAIALAAQDTISNIIAGFLIMLDRPFAIGDEIKLPSGEKVKVLDIGVRRSRFLSEDNAILIMPNLDLSKSKITNYSIAEREKKEKVG